MTVFKQARMQNFNVGSVNQAIQNKAANNPYLAKMTNQNSAVAALKQDTYTPSNRIMSYEDFYALMTSDKSPEEKHAALVEVYGDVLSFCAYETGMKAVQNGSFSLEEYHSEMERRSALKKVSLADFAKLFYENDPNRAEMERDAERAKKFVPIQNKMFAGKPLSGAEKQFLQEHYPEFYAKAVQIEQEVAQLKAKLKAAKSKEEASQIYLDTKMRLIGDGKDPASVFFTGPAIDAAYQSMK